MRVSAKIFAAIVMLILVLVVAAYWLLPVAQRKETPIIARGAPLVDPPSMRAPMKESAAENSSSDGSHRINPVDRVFQTPDANSWEPEKAQMPGPVKTASLPQRQEQSASGADLTGSVTPPLALSLSIIGQRRVPDGSYSEVMVREGSVLRSGDNFQVHLESNSPAYVYILLYDSHGKASQLFPDPKIEHAGFVKERVKVVVPAQDLWFWLDDHPGTETLYVLASKSPMADIRDLLARMEAADEDDRKRVSLEVKRKISQRGLAVVAKGPSATYTLSDGKKIQRVTEVVTGKASVVRAVSFHHR